MIILLTLIKRLIKYEGDTKDGVPHGTGEESILNVEDEEEIVIFKGEYRNGLRNGYGVAFHTSGPPQYWAGEWLDNEKWFGAYYYKDKIEQILIDHLILKLTT